MTERPRIPLVFGSGMDRATGVLGADPRSMRDLRNVYLYRDKVQARKGHSIASQILDDGGQPLSHIVLIHHMRSEQIGVVVGYQQSDRQVHVYRVDGTGSGANFIGTWFTLATGAHEPPRIIAAESYQKLFLAHDETRLSNRAQTYYYDPFGGTQLVGLTGDLNRDGTAEPIKFRGVQDYLNYLVGWGYGTGSDEDRPEIIRVSVPGNPTKFEPEHYFIAGIGDDPILRCLPTSDRLIAFKGSSQYEIIGYDRRTFGIKPGEQFYGVAASRLAVAVGGAIYFWSYEGPRVTVGGASRDLAWPLDLDAPSPSDLVAEGALLDGFAIYLPGRRVIQFIFGRRCYNLSLWDPQEPKWSYGELGVAVFCGGILYSGGEAVSGPPAGAPSGVSGSGQSPSVLEVSWTNNALEGGEIAEIWLKTATGAWSLAGSVSATGATQSSNISGLLAGTQYSIAMRYRRGPYYSPNSDSSNPDDWPAAQKGTGTTTLTAPTLNDTSWERVSATVERVNVVFTPAHADVNVVIKRNGVEIDTVTAAQHGGAQYTYHDTGILPEDSNTYNCLHRKDTDSPTSNSITQWGGPEPPPSGLTCSQFPPEILVQWTNGDATLPTEIWANNYTQNSGYLLRETVAAGMTSEGISVGVSGDTIGVNVRHKKTTFGVDDFTPFVSGTGNPALDECLTTMP